MNANELRIGNFVSVNTMLEPPYYVTGNVIAEVDKGEMIVEPIPLTEEWLLKFEFVKDIDSWFDKKYDISIVDEPGEDPVGDGVISINSETLIALMGQVGCYDETTKQGYCSYEIKYVHQLQNLFFSLTGEELTIQTK